STNIVFSQVSAKTKYPCFSMNWISASFFSHLVVEMKESVSQQITSGDQEPKSKARRINSSAPSASIDMNCGGFGEACSANISFKAETLTFTTFRILASNFRIRSSASLFKKVL